MFQEIYEFHDFHFCFLTTGYISKIFITKMNSALERKYKYWNILLITPFNVYPYKRIINLQITGTHTLSLSHARTQTKTASKCHQKRKNWCRAKNSSNLHKRLLPGTFIRKLVNRQTPQNGRTHSKIGWLLSTIVWVCLTITVLSAKGNMKRQKKSLN